MIKIFLQLEVGLESWSEINFMIIHFGVPFFCEMWMFYPCDLHKPIFFWCWNCEIDFWLLELWTSLLLVFTSCLNVLKIKMTNVKRRKKFFFWKTLNNDLDLFGNRTKTYTNYQRELSLETSLWILSNIMKILLA